MKFDRKFWTRAFRARTLLRLAAALGLLLAITLIWLSNSYLTARFSEAQKTESLLRAAAQTTNIQSAMQRHAVLPFILSRDATLISALQSEDYINTSQRLLVYQDEIGGATLMLADGDGRIVASSDRTQLGRSVRDHAYFAEALRDNETIFTNGTPENGFNGFYYSRKISDGTEPLGVIIVSVELRALEKAWRDSGTLAVVTDSDDTILLTSRLNWRYKSLTELLNLQEESSTLRSALGLTPVTASEVPQVLIDGARYLRTETRVGFRGWRLTYFTPLNQVRVRVNAVLALEIMTLALITALAAYVLARRVQRQSLLIRRESIELRALNRRLSEEIAERQRVEQTLHHAEQSLEQASKLAALGQMSAAVSHELNQPLAAMRTYLAGARLLVQRKRPAEALTSFQRIDDLIERMGAITRQLKSYARKSGDDLSPLDMRDSVASSLALMAPQLKYSPVAINKTLPKEPVMVLGDALRLEQVIVNLLRNAIDASKNREAPQIDILLIPGETVTLAVRDNGDGFKDAEKLFEPFYTTKRPGEGIGLGLAISAGIASEMGGRLVARNRREGTGAVFELQLPGLPGVKAAAE
jgi:two-component system, NtrC family, C4-dicarboxylate transport sensor histidine kinase DctB